MELINIRLSNGNNEIVSYKKVPCIVNNDKISFIIDDIKTTISDIELSRENKEYIFTLDIKNKLSTYTLKEINNTYDIEVENLEYIKNDKIIELIYKISSNEEPIKIIIEREI